MQTSSAYCASMISEANGPVLLQNYSCYCQPCVSVPSTPAHAAHSKSAIAKFGAVAFASIVTISVLLVATIAAVGYKMKQDAKLTAVGSDWDVVRMIVQSCIIRLPGTAVFQCHSNAALLLRSSLYAYMVCLVCQDIQDRTHLMLSMLTGSIAAWAAASSCLQC